MEDEEEKEDVMEGKEVVLKWYFKWHSHPYFPCNDTWKGLVGFFLVFITLPPRGCCFQTWSSCTKWREGSGGGDTTGTEKKKVDQPWDSWKKSKEMKEDEIPGTRHRGNTSLLGRFGSRKYWKNIRPALRKRRRAEAKYSPEGLLGRRVWSLRRIAINDERKWILLTQIGGS